MKTPLGYLVDRIIGHRIIGLGYNACNVVTHIAMTQIEIFAEEKVSGALFSIDRIPKWFEINNSRLKFDSDLKRHSDLSMYHLIGVNYILPILNEIHKVKTNFDPKLLTNYVFDLIFTVFDGCVKTDRENHYVIYDRFDIRILKSKDSIGFVVKDLNVGLKEIEQSTLKKGEVPDTSTKINNIKYHKKDHPLFSCRVGIEEIKSFYLSLFEALIFISNNYTAPIPKETTRDGYEKVLDNIMKVMSVSNTNGTQLCYYLWATEDMTSYPERILKVSSTSTHFYSFEILRYCDPINSSLNIPSVGYTDLIELVGAIRKEIYKTNSFKGLNGDLPGIAINH